MFTLTNQIGLSWIPNICLFRNQDCWLSTLKKAPKGHQTLFHVRGWGLVCMRGRGLRGLDLGTRLVSLVCALFATYPKVVQFVRKKRYCAATSHILIQYYFLMQCDRLIIFDQFDTMWRNSFSAVSILSQGSSTLVWCFWRLDHLNTSTQRTDSKDVYTYQP